MTVSDLLKTGKFKEIVVTDGTREIVGVYIGDLLSWVMGRAEADNAWITIMSNVNVIAVATLVDVSCVILAEGVTLDENIASTAHDKGINVISSELSIYDIAKLLAGILV